MKVRVVVIRNFVVCSVLAGFVGILEANRASSVTPDTAGAAETMFRAVSAAVIGGTLLAGGQGTAIGALFGALFLGILRDGLTLEGVNADYLDFILGVGDPGRDDHQRLRRPGAEGERCLRTSCASRTWPSASARSRRCATSTCTCGKGEVLGLLGDNGAGKSTLIKIISGFQKPDEGRLIIKGEETELRSVDHARSLGIDCVYQDLALVNQLDVVQNMFLRREMVHSPFPFLARAPDARARRARRWTRSASTCRGSTCRSRGCPAASARRSRSPARCTRTPTSSCSTSRWPRWAPRRAR